MDRLDRIIRFDIDEHTPALSFFRRSFIVSSRHSLLVGEVVGVDANTVPANQTGAEE
jgi:hypothetical protein